MLSLARVALGVALALAAAELYVRPIYTLAVAYEPGIGYVNAPGRARWGLEGIATSTFREHGLRAGFAAEGQPVLVLGDSYAEGLMVEDEEVFPAVAQAALGAAGVQLALVNAGRSTLSIADYVALAPRYDELVHPTWTVVQLRSSDLAEDAWQTNGRTHFERDASGKLSVRAFTPPPRSGWRGWLFDLRQQSMLFGYGAVRFGRFRDAAESEPSIFRAATPRPTASPLPSPPVEEELSLLREAWRDRLTLLFLSSTTPTPDPIEARVRDACSRAHLSCVFTREAFRELEKHGRSPYGFANTHAGVGHLNADGHAIAGRLLADELRKTVNSQLQVQR